MQIEAYGWGAPEFEGYTVRLGEADHKLTMYWSGYSHGEFEHTWSCPSDGDVVSSLVLGAPSGLSRQISVVGQRLGGPGRIVHPPRTRRYVTSWPSGRTIMTFSVGAAMALTCAIAMPGCSGTADGIRGSYVSRPVPSGHVLLVPELLGGWAGWCVATGYKTTMESSAGCVEATTTSTGPIVAKVGCESDATKIDIYALTTGEVMSVSVYGGTQIPLRLTLHYLMGCVLQL